MLEQAIADKGLAFKLYSISNLFSAAFSYRMMLYIVPLLALREENGHFLWYWSSQNRRENLLNIFRSFNESLYWITNRDLRRKTYADSLFLMAEEAADTADRLFMVSESVENIDAALAISDWVDSANAVVRAIMSAAYLSEAIDVESKAENFIHTVASSIDALAYYDGGVSEALIFEAEKISEAVDINDYLSQEVRLPQQGQNLLDHFLKAVANLSQGFEYWARWFRDRMQGIAVVPKQLYLSVDIPEDVERRGVYAVNLYLNEQNQTVVSGMR